MSSEKSEEWVISRPSSLGVPAGYEEVDRELKLAQLISFLASLLQTICKVIFEALTSMTSYQFLPLHLPYARQQVRAIACPQFIASCSNIPLQSISKSPVCISRHSQMLLAGINS